MIHSSRFVNEQIDGSGSYVQAFEFRASKEPTLHIVIDHDFSPFKGAKLILFTRIRLTVLSMVLIAALA